MLEDVLDFDRRVEGQPGKRFLQGPADSKTMGRTVEEIGIAKRDVPRAGMDLGARIGDDRIARDGEHSAAVDGGDGAMGASVVTTTGGLDVTCRYDHAIPLQARVAPQFRERVADGQNRFDSL